MVRFMEEDIENPPFFLHNMTYYDIYYRQQLVSKKKGCCSKKTKKEDNKMKQLYPGDLEKYTWEEWITLNNEHVLEIDIEGHRMEYNIDKI